MVKKRAQSFQRTRRQHLSETAEDYTELVLDLIHECGEARVTELARRLGVSHVTALKTAQRLKKIGLLAGAPRAPLQLTKKGALIAKRSKKRHEIVVALLVALGVTRKTAETDAEGIEHHLSRDTIAVFERYLRNRHAD
jgi:DtxR family transcriptional regulator, manganese transport regulator